MAINYTDNSRGDMAQLDDYYDVDDVTNDQDVVMDDDDDSVKDDDTKDKDTDDDKDSTDGGDDTDVDADADDKDDDTSDDDTSDDDKDDSDDDNPSDDGVHTPLFTKEQQTKVNEIVQARLDRQEKSLISKLTDASGVDMEGIGEIQKAAELWGLLKSNSSLSAEVNQAINKALQEGKARIPEKKSSQVDNRMVEINKREAILDMKSSDTVFARHSKEVLSWAEQEGFEISDEKSLKHAYLAWKGVNASKLAQAKKTVADKKKSDKATVKQKASVQKGTSKRTSSKTNSRSMSDLDILSSEGLSLFIDD